jgi:hypothetical protein
MQLSNLKVADKIKFGKVGDEPIVWLIGAHAHYAADKTVIVAERTLGNITFSPANPADENHDRRLRGNNRYKTSYVRKYINDSDFIKSIFVPDETEKIKATKIITIRPSIDIEDKKNIDVTKDRLFLLSAVEIGLSEEIAESENNPHFENDNTIKLFEKQEYRTALDIDGNPDWWLLRTPDASDSYLVRDVLTDGTLYYYTAYVGSRGLRPACNLVSDIPVSDMPDIDGCYTLA